ncbi:MAG: hypothetical protein NUW21_15525, partial [Elusimicrobia bacterium]|nr:hypothetical protein [Elusimicrobiota bacterium]
MELFLSDDGAKPFGDPAHGPGTGKDAGISLSIRADTQLAFAARAAQFSKRGFRRGLARTSADPAQAVYPDRRDAQALQHAPRRVLMSGIRFHDDHRGPDLQAGPQRPVDRHFGFREASLLLDDGVVDFVLGGVKRKGKLHLVKLERLLYPLGEGRAVREYLDRREIQRPRVFYQAGETGVKCRLAADELNAPAAELGSLAQHLQPIPLLHLLMQRPLGIGVRIAMEAT